jgi:hypothetical protein
MEVPATHQTADSRVGLVRPAGRCVPTLDSLGEPRKLQVKLCGCVRARGDRRRKWRRTERGDPGDLVAAESLQRRRRGEGECVNAGLGPKPPFKTRGAVRPPPGAVRGRASQRI